MNESRRILWIDDEIEFLKPHIFFLKNKGYDITPVSNGDDGLSLIKEQQYDAVLLDQIMPGRDGMNTLSLIRDLEPNLPVIMVTKSDEEELMDEAIGNRIDDFLVKPLSPGRILPILKRVLDQDKIIEKKVPRNYTKEFNEIRMLKEIGPNWEEWISLYLRLSEWDIEFDHIGKTGLEETHIEQKKECNALFSNYVEQNYLDWLNGKNSPDLSVDVISKHIVPLLNQGLQVYFIVVDCLRLDQWLTIEPLLLPYFQVTRNYYYSILPSATLYSRNALFSGLFPKEIAEKYPKYWKEVPDDETSTNKYEKKMLEIKLQQMGLNLSPPPRYFKIFDTRGGEEYIRHASSANRISLAAVVVNFIDILTHKRSQIDILQQISPDESAFRSLTKSWFTHSALFEILKIISRKKNTVVVLTSDHGSILSNRASKAFGNRDTSTSLRFKVGNNLGCDPDEAVHITTPKDYRLPGGNIGKNYILAKEDYYFVYPNQFHEYKRQFRGGFQHGGISLEEMILPCVFMKPR
ncbi:response regulator [Candidatus Poribacteria bacterium]|nr:response regulator [Candidatus Poribacteria bacterium]